MTWLMKLTECNNKFMMSLGDSVVIMVVIRNVRHVLKVISSNSPPSTKILGLHLSRLEAPTIGDQL